MIRLVSAQKLIPFFLCRLTEGQAIELQIFIPVLYDLASLPSAIRAHGYALSCSLANRAQDYKDLALTRQVIKQVEAFAFFTNDLHQRPTKSPTRRSEGGAQGLGLRQQRRVPAPALLRPIQPGQHQSEDPRAGSAKLQRQKGATEGSDKHR